eukprot:CAMPEP_0202896378 /NCGR_PEP_ID=MMETSP1392-20130828/5391_1 /ASSEMBLY_ACC=CAM_ASM_000868 /TAXON_ID=225041 /ORGANISM="Chlamydomonas chlamydogama, Strain SAG 11-48b" /LENGTH=662 /DNA_ID=CAMNT_0049581723 /DNA_START=427 /DNA_END=2413 /DNA_ORIENTATION=+
MSVADRMDVLAVLGQLQSTTMLEENGTCHDLQEYPFSSCPTFQVESSSLCTRKMLGETFVSIILVVEELQSLASFSYPLLLVATIAPVEVLLVCNAGVAEAFASALQNLGVPLSIYADVHVAARQVRGRFTVVLSTVFWPTVGWFGPLLQTAIMFQDAVVVPTVYLNGNLAWGRNDHGLVDSIEAIPMCFMAKSDVFRKLLPLPTTRTVVVSNVRVFNQPKSSVEYRASKTTPLVFKARSPLCSTLYVDVALPTPDKDSGSRRTVHLLTALRRIGHRVTFQALWKGDDAYQQFLTLLGVEVLPSAYPATWTLTKCLFHIIIIARRYAYEQTHQQLRLLCPDAVVVYDTIDLHFLREARVQMSKETNAYNFELESWRRVVEWLGKASGPQANELNRVKALELSFVRRSNITYVVSEEEVAVVKSFLPNAPVFVVSNIINVDSRVEPSVLDFESRSGAIFVGHFSHEPNQQALHMIEKVILEDPRVLLLGIKFHIVGSGSLPDALRNRLQSNPRIVFHGQLTDTELSYVYSKVRLAVAPLVSGAGVKGKVNQAMASGVPVVATTVAVEGMHVQDAKDCMVGTTMSSFIDKLLTAYQNYDVWQTLQANGFDNVASHFSVERAVDALKETLSCPLYEQLAEASASASVGVHAISPSNQHRQLSVPG